MWLKEAKSILGIEVDYQTSASRIVEQADLEEWMLNETGFFTSVEDGTTYIIKSPLSSFLIQARIRHIDENFEQFWSTHESQARFVLGKRMFLKGLLESFDEELITKGREALENEENKVGGLPITTSMDRELNYEI